MKASGRGRDAAEGGTGEPEIVVAGSVDGHEVRLRYAPKRDVTPWEVATLLRLPVAVAAGERRGGDWVEWAARHGLLRHFDPLYLDYSPASPVRGAAPVTVAAGEPATRLAASGLRSGSARAHGASAGTASPPRTRCRSSTTTATPLPAIRAIPARARAFGSSPQTTRPDATPQSARL